MISKKTPPPAHNNQMQCDDKHNTNAVPLPPDEACNADPACARPDLEGGEGEIVYVARACQEEATVAHASPPSPLTLQSIINFLPDEAFLAKPPPRAMIWAQQGWELVID